MFNIEIIFEIVTIRCIINCTSTDQDINAILFIIRELIEKFIQIIIITYSTIK